MLRCTQAPVPLPNVKVLSRSPTCKLETRASHVEVRPEQVVKVDWRSEPVLVGHDFKFQPAETARHWIPTWLLEYGGSELLDAPDLTVSSRAKSKAGKKRKSLDKNHAPINEQSASTEGPPPKRSRGPSRSAGRYEIAQSPVKHDQVNLVSVGCSNLSRTMPIAEGSVCRPSRPSPTSHDIFDLDSSLPELADLLKTPTNKANATEHSLPSIGKAVFEATSEHASIAQPRPLPESKTFGYMTVTRKQDVEVIDLLSDD